MSIRIVSRLALHLACGGLLAAGPLAVDAAWAQSAPAVFEGAGMIELVPPSGLVGDGATAADLYVVALNAAGQPILGLKGKPTTTGGTATDLVEIGGGVYRFSFTPPMVDGARAVSITLKGKLPSKEAFTKGWNVNVTPARSRQLTLAANPGTLTLGQDKTASLAFNLAGGDRQALNGVDLRINASSGSVENLTHLGGGQFTSLYNVPSVNYPHVALVTVVDRRDPTRTFGALAVPLVGKADYPVTVAPNAKVIMKVAGRDFGPVAADAMGRAKVPIVVPPGVQTASRVQIAGDGKITEETIDLRIPEAKRIALFPAAAAIPSDARLQVPLRAVVVTPEGKPDENAQVVFAATAGAVGAARHEGGGIYVATYTPPAGNASTQATVTVNLADRPAIQADSIAIDLIPTRATKLTLAAEPVKLPAGADGFKIFAKVLGPDGSGLGGRDVQFAASGARLKGDVKDLRNGDYQAVFNTVGTAAVDLTASVATAPTGNPLARVLLLPARDRLPADGVTNALLTVATVDEFGYPVPNVQVALRLGQGDGAVPASATTNANGLAQVYYTAGRKNGMITVEATAGDVAAATALVQAPETLALPTLPTSGAKAVAQLTQEWAGSLSAMRIEREGATGAAAPPPIMASAPVGGTVPAKAALLSEPATASAGGSVLLKIQLSDEGGRGVGGQKLEFLTSQGSVGAVTDLGGGAYQATYTVPAGASGEVKISVATVDGAVSSFMRLPIGGAEAAWGTNPFGTQPAAEPAPQPVAQPVAASPAPAQPAQPAPQPAAVTPAPAPGTTVTVKKTPSGDFPWLYVDGGYQVGSYTYDQLVLTQQTVLFPSPIGVTAAAQGLGVDARVWVPGLPYVGADVSLGMVRYGLDPAPLCEKLGRPCAETGTVSDWVTEVDVLAAGRYPLALGGGGTRLSLGAVAGISNSDIQIYKNMGNEIELEQLAITSLAAGPELGLELSDPGIFLRASLVEHWAGASTPWNTRVKAEAGWAFVDHVYASVAFNTGWRDIQVTNTAEKPVGEVSDRMLGGQFALGFQY